MRKLIDILFGVESKTWTEDGTLAVDWVGLPGGDRLFWVGLIGALALWGVIWLYLKEGRAISRRMRMAMATLRIGLLAIVLVMLLEPVLVFSKVEQVPSNLLVLVDRTESMGLRDSYTNETIGNRIATGLKLPEGIKTLRETRRLDLAKKALSPELLSQLAAGGKRIVKVHPFSGQLEPAVSIEAIKDLSVNGQTTGIGAAIRSAMAAYRRQPVAGILLITEGQNNAGESPIKAAESAGAEKVPVVVMSAGTLEGPRNAKVVKLQADPTVFVKDTNRVVAIVEARGMEKQPGVVVLERRRDGGAWEEYDRREVILGEAGQLQQIEFTFAEAAPAKVEFRATLRDAGVELTLDDNTSLASVNIVRSQIRVLFIAGATFPEVQFVRAALYRDKGVQLSTWLQSADEGYEHMGTDPIRRLPTTQEELEKYDCIVLYDPDPRKWSPDFPKMMMEFVGKAGGGLIYIAGERMTRQLFDQPGDPANAWLKMLPIVREPGLFTTEVSIKLSAQQMWKLDITSSGQSDPIFRFDTDDAKNQQILKNLPGMYWHFPVTRPKPGATVLARHADPRMSNQYGQHVLVATQLVGPGRTLFVGFDSTYRWRYLDDQYFDGFWARIIDRAGRTKLLGGRNPFTLKTDRLAYQPGSQVTLSATFSSAQDQDAGLSELHGEVEAPGEERQPITLSPTGDPGSFAATFDVSKAGAHSVRVWTGGRDVGALAKAATMQFEVELPNLEYERPSRDRVTIASIAQASGGDAFEMDQADEIAKAFKMFTAPNTLQDRQEIWDAPIFFIAVLTLLFAEWVLRKKYRLV